MGDLIDITVRGQEPLRLFPTSADSLAFEVKASFNIRLTLAKSLSFQSEVYEIDFGNHVSGICKNHSDQFFIQKDTREILSEEEYRGFWIKWNVNCLRVGHAGSKQPFLSYTLPEPFRTSYFGFSYDNSRQPLAHLKFEVPPLLPTRKTIPISGGEAHWVSATDGDDEEGVGRLPVGVMIGGYLEEPLHIARARHRGSLTPGYFRPSHGTAYISWAGRDHAKEEFEVLCGYNVEWIPTVDNIIPQNAVEGGYSEVRSEPLYIGRAYHEGHLLVGKVQPSHKCCYIPYMSNEIAKKEFEVLVNRNQQDISGITVHENGFIVPSQRYLNLSHFRLLH